MVKVTAVAVVYVTAFNNDAKVAFSMMLYLQLPVLLQLSMLL